MITSSNNSSHILKNNVSDIFEQLKKKAEDMSTSEGSIHIFQNLKNPTNLTNPQIISLRKVGTYENSEDSRNKSKLNKSRNKVHSMKRVKSDISELHDEFLISEQIKKILLRKEPKLVFDKVKKRIYDDYSKKSVKEKDKKNKTIEKLYNNEDVWTKLKKINNISKDKIVRINKRKNISARDYVSDTKDIQLMKYIQKNKIERLNMLTNLKKTELNSVSNTILSLENNKDFIINNYNEKYASYVNYLKKRKDEEEKNNFDLFLTSEKIRKEISQLQLRYNKKKKEKNYMVNMALLLIQIKEKMRTIPPKAVSLFESNMNSLDGHRRGIKKPKTVFTKTNKIFFDEEINKIMKYRGRVIYKDIFEFDYDYQQIEDRVRNKFKEKEKLDIEIADLKEEYNKVKEEAAFDPYAEDKNELNKAINKLKVKNEELKQEIISLKLKFSDAKYNILTKKKHILKHSTSTLSVRNNSINNIGNESIINKDNNFFFKNSNIYYDNYSTLYGFKSIYTLNNFNFNKMIDVSDLYMSCFKLYKTSKNNLFEKIEINFDVEKNMKSPKINEDLVIIKMLEYIDQIVTLLIIQKNHCMSDVNLKKKYEKVRNLLERDKRRMKFINNLREEEEKQKLKIQELEIKKNKANYIPSKKSEYKYYFKAQKDHLIKIKKLTELRKPPTFEDFMHDIMV